MITELSIAIPLAVLCVVVSAFCSGAEVALFSLRRTERDRIAGSSRFLDRRIAALLDRPRRVVATVLIGNEAFNSVLVVLALLVVERWVLPVPAFAIAIAVSLLVVLIAEVTTRTLAVKAPLSWSRLCVMPLATFAMLVLPARLVVQALSALVLRLFGVSASRSERDLSEEEFRTLVDAGSAQGQVDPRERRLIHRVFEFNDKNVGQVMTPRDRIFALSYDLPAQRLVKEIAARGFSRVPIYAGQRSLDNIRGILNAKDLLRTTTGHSLGRPLGELLHEPLFVPRTTPVKRLFLTFKQKKVHMAIVVSEYGKVLGLVTMDDLLAQIFGVLRDERAALQNPTARPPARTPIGIKVDPEVGGDGQDGVPVAVGAAERRDTNERSVPVPLHEDGPALHDEDHRDHADPAGERAPGDPLVHAGTADPPEPADEDRGTAAGVLDSIDPLDPLDRLDPLDPLDPLDLPGQPMHLDEADSIVDDVGAGSTGSLDDDDDRDDAAVIDDDDDAMTPPATDIAELTRSPERRSIPPELSRKARDGS